MKTIFTTTLIVCVAVITRGQNIPNTTQKALDAIKLRNAKIDSVTFSKLSAQVLTPANLFKSPALAANRNAFKSNATVVYSTMPVATLTNTDKRGVAIISGKNYNMPVKQLIVVAPKH